jgi:multidrug transporter EmrE-like cation transporter
MFYGVSHVVFSTVMVKKFGAVTKHICQAIAVVIIYFISILFLDAQFELVRVIVLLILLEGGILFGVGKSYIPISAIVVAKTK